MTIRNKIIKEIISKIERIPDDQLEAVLSYLDKIEGLTDKKKSILSFAGSWQNIDDTLFKEFTEDLHAGRLKETDPN